MIEDDLRASFAARAAEHPDTADLTDVVIGRATAVRRRRTVVAAAVSTVAAAVVGFMAIAPGDQAATEVPVATPRPAPVAYGAHHVLLSDGTELRLSDTPIREVLRVEGGWLVSTEKTATFVPDQGAPVQLGPEGDYPNLTVDRAGTRVAVQTWTGESSQVTAYALPSVEPLGSAQAPDWVASRWVAGKLLVTAVNGDAGPVPHGYWDPASGQPRLTGELLVLGALGSDLLAAVPDGDDTCLVRLNPDLTETSRTCDIGFRFGDQVPEVSPDGRHLLASLDGALVSIDIAQAFTGRPTRVPMAVPADSSTIAWDSITTALFRTPDNRVLRCTLDGAPCAPYAVPTVAGARAVGMVPVYPDLAGGQFVA